MHEGVAHPYSQDVGGLAGVIFVEDIAEELVGEITDEHDPPEPAASASQPPGTDDGGWTVPGAMHIDEARLIDHDLPSGDYHTIGGLIMARLGRLPEPGDAIQLALPDVDTGGERKPLPASARPVDFERAPECGRAHPNRRMWAGAARRGAGCGNTARTVHVSGLVAGALTGVE